MRRSLASLVSGRPLAYVCRLDTTLDPFSSDAFAPVMRFGKIQSPPAWSGATQAWSRSPAPATVGLQQVCVRPLVATALVQHAYAATANEVMHIPAVLPSRCMHIRLSVPDTRVTGRMATALS